MREAKDMKHTTHMNARCCTRMCVCVCVCHKSACVIHVCIASHPCASRAGVSYECMCVCNNQIQPQPKSTLSWPRKTLNRTRTAPL